MTVVDPRCADCTAEIVVEENDQHGMRLTIRHDPTCPWLAARDNGHGSAWYSVHVLHLRRKP
jgi:hypothetical protein